MHRFTFQIETVYKAKRPQDLDCVGLLERLRIAFVGGQRRRVPVYARSFRKRSTLALGHQFGRY